MHSGARLAGAVGPRLEDREGRLLLTAVLGSLALHVLMLYLLPLLGEAQPARPAPQPLTAQLVRPKPPPPELPRTEPQPPAPVRNAAKPRPAPAPASPPSVPAPVLALESPKAPAEPPAFVVPPAPPPSAAPVQTPAAPAVAAGAPDPGNMARFRLELMEIARRYKRYPRLAQDNNWEGRVELRVAFTENGTLQALTVTRSAGRAVLDEAAQSMIRSALPQLSVPQALRGKPFALEIPVDFSLKDER
jgi:protein TonB